jgi:hypothetical protein
MAKPSFTAPSCSDQNRDFETSIRDLADDQIRRAVDAWIRCPANKRPSAEALGTRVAEIASLAAKGVEQ